MACGHRSGGCRSRRGDGYCRAMRLALLFDDAPPAVADVEISSLTYDNRLVREGTLFFCVPGYTRDGHDFAPDAVARGAAALVVERPLNLGVPEMQVPSVRAAMAPAAARFTETHRSPADRRASPGPTARPRRRSWCVRCSRPRAARPGCWAP